MVSLSAWARARRPNAGGKEKDHRIGSRTATKARVSKRTGRSRSVAGAPVSSARYRRPDVRLGAPALGVNFGFLYL